MDNNKDSLHSCFIIESWLDIETTCRVTYLFICSIIRFIILGVTIGRWIGTLIVTSIRCRGRVGIMIIRVVPILIIISLILISRRVITIIVSILVFGGHFIHRVRIRVWIVMRRWIILWLKISTNRNNKHTYLELDL